MDPTPLPTNVRVILQPASFSGVFLEADDPDITKKLDDLSQDKIAIIKCGPMGQDLFHHLLLESRVTPTIAGANAKGFWASHGWSFVLTHDDEIDAVIFPKSVAGKRMSKAYRLFLGLGFFASRLLGWCKG